MKNLIASLVVAIAVVTVCSGGDAPEKTLREKLVDLWAQKAERMSNDEVAAAIKELHQELEEEDKQADADLKAATGQLLSLIDKYPRTKAANAAARMMETMHKSRLQ